MKVIVKKTGEVKNVTDGHARNYLIPSGLAEIATPEKIRQAQAVQKKKVAAMAQNEAEWSALAKQLPSLKVEIQAKTNEDGTLFGALKESAIIKAMKEQQLVTLDASWIQIPDPIKHTGEHTVQLVLPNKLKSSFVVQVQAQ